MEEQSLLDLDAARVALGIFFGNEWKIAKIDEESCNRVCKNLQKLILDTPEAQYQKMFPRGWIVKMSNYITNLTSLSICICSQQDFKAICRAYPLLTKLEIPETKVKTLRGISRLSKLETLNISRIDFGKKEELKEIFELKELKSLDVGGTPGCVPGTNLSSFMVKYLKCKKSLPNLKTLDCSYNKMDEKMLQQLVKSHKSLEKISLIGTPIEQRAQFEIPSQPELLTIENLEQTLNSVEYYCGFQEPPHPLIYQLLDPNVLNYLCDPLIHHQTQENLKRSLYIACNAWRLYPNEYEVRIRASEIIRALSYPVSLNQMGFEEKQEVIQSLLTDIPEWKDPLQDKEAFELSSFILRIFCIKEVFENSSENIDAICGFLASNAMKIKDVDSEYLFRSLNLLAHGFSLMTQPSQKSMSTPKFKLHLLSIVYNFKEGTYLGKIIMDLMIHLYSNMPEADKNPENIPFDQFCVETLMLLVKLNYEDESWKHNIFHNFKTLLMFLPAEACNVVLKPRTFTYLSKLISGPSNEMKWLSSEFLVQVHLKSIDKCKLFTDLAGSVLEILESYVPTRELDSLEPFRYVLDCSTTSEVTAFAKYFIEHFEKSDRMMRPAKIKRSESF